jgi:hypothetical protein
MSLYSKEEGGNVGVYVPIVYSHESNWANYWIGHYLLRKEMVNDKKVSYRYIVAWDPMAYPWQYACSPMKQLVMFVFNFISIFHVGTLIIF